MDTKSKKIPQPRTASAPLTLDASPVHHEYQVFDGLAISATSIDAAVEELISRAKSGTAPEAYRLVNAYSVALASKTPAYKALLAGRGINLPDGRPLASVLRRTANGGPAVAQVRGPSFFEAVLRDSRDAGLRHYFLGSSERTLVALEAQVTARYPGLIVAGSYSPPFRELEESDHKHHDELIRASGADIVWVGMGTPRQDFEARRIADSVGVTAVGVGAAFDFSAGVKPLAPEWVRENGFEWAFRLITEPRRLGRRYLVGNTIFLGLAAKHTLQR